MTKIINKLFWHDGNLVDVFFNIDKKGDSTVQIKALLYDDEQATVRNAFQIKCENVLYFNTTLNVAELKNNQFAGNISNGYLKDCELWIYLTDGMLQVRAKKFRLVKC
jgi:hypothetical protein